MSTWWRQARDKDGRTIVERLEGDYSYDPESRYDEDGFVVPYVPSTCHQRWKRIRSILRRLKICPRCKRGKVYAVRMRMKLGEFDGYTGELIACPVCGGTGRVKEER